MEVVELYPFWERERRVMLEGLERVSEKLEEEGGPKRAEGVFNWTPPGWSRSINDLLRHIAYVEHYVIDSLILGREPKDVLVGSAFPAGEHPTFFHCLRLMRDVHEATISALRGIEVSELNKEIPAFGLRLSMGRLLWSIVQEEAHHRGQIYLLLRIQGVVPPERTD